MTQSVQRFGTDFSRNAGLETSCDTAGMEEFKEEYWPRRKEIGKELMSSADEVKTNDEPDEKANKKRKEQDGEDKYHDDGNDEPGNEDLSTQKKPRLVWANDLQRLFVAAVNQLGFDKAVPTKILELMNVKGLTRENVASHLQKFRLQMKKMGRNQGKKAEPGVEMGVKDSISLQNGHEDLSTILSGRFSNISRPVLVPSDAMQGRTTEHAPLDWSMTYPLETQPVPSFSNHSLNLFQAIPTIQDDGMGMHWIYGGIHNMECLGVSDGLYDHEFSCRSMDSSSIPITYRDENIGLDEYGLRYSLDNVLLHSNALVNAQDYYTYGFMDQSCCDETWDGVFQSSMLPYECHQPDVTTFTCNLLPLTNLNISSPPALSTSQMISDNLAINSLAPSMGMFGQGMHCQFQPTANLIEGINRASQPNWENQYQTFEQDFTHNFTGPDAVCTESIGGCLADQSITDLHIIQGIRSTRAGEDYSSGIPKWQDDFHQTSYQPANKIEQGLEVGSNGDCWSDT